MTGESVIWFLAILIGAFLGCLCLTGCATTGYRPHTVEERQALGHAIVGQALDCATTSYILSDGGDEANGIWWNPEDTGSLVSVKIVLVGGAWLIGNVRPAWRMAMYQSLYIIGYGASAWNGVQIAIED